MTLIMVLLATAEESVHGITLGFVSSSLSANTFTFDNVHQVRPLDPCFHHADYRPYPSCHLADAVPRCSLCVVLEVGGLDFPVLEW
jgi:hypothetical protein